MTQSHASVYAAAPAEAGGESRWVEITQERIDLFAVATLDPDPMHIDPAWARAHSPFGGTVAFGFLTISLLTHLIHDALGTGSGKDPSQAGVYLNYGFDRLRLVTPVPSGGRVRGRFKQMERKRDEKGRWLVAFDCVIEIEGCDKPALVARWLSMWLPPSTEIGTP